MTFTLHTDTDGETKMTDEKVKPWYEELTTPELLAIFAEEMRMPGVKPDDPQIVQMRDELARRKDLPG